MNNACATQAILSILFNCTDSIDIGDMMRQFRNDTLGLTSKQKGEAIGNQPEVRKVHNSFGRADPMMHEGKYSSSVSSSSKEEDVFHFVAYVPFKSAIYELDGLKSGPVKIAPLGENDDWITVLLPFIEYRMKANSHINFSLMAVTRDKRLVCAEKISEIESKIISLPPEEREAEEENLKKSQRALEEVNNQFKSWEEENKRRRHDYLPFINSMLSLLAKRGKLTYVVEVAERKNGIKREVKTPTLQTEKAKPSPSHSPAPAAEKEEPKLSEIVLPAASASTTATSMTPTMAPSTQDQAS